MPLFMDGHTVDGELTVDGVARARIADLMKQPAYDVRYLRYWVAVHSGMLFCLVEAPSAIAASTVHLEAHGGVAQQLFPVHEGH
jgi:hypothetical protein